MTKGIIQTEFDGALVRTTEIEESDVVFVVAAKRGGESLTDSDWTVQNIARIDGANRKELIELLVGFIKEILTNICDGKPTESADAMKLFLRRLIARRISIYWNTSTRLWLGRSLAMEDRYRRMWLLYRERMARRAGEAASTEKKEMYDWVLEETALIEAEVFLEE